MSMSHDMKIPYVTLMDSRVTRREIGTKFISAINRTPTLKMN